MNKVEKNCSKRKALLLTVLLSVVGVLSNQVMAEQLVSVNKAYQQQGAERYRVIGTLRASANSALAASDAAKIELILVNEGDFVEKGQVVAKLDNRRFKLEIDRQKSTLAQLEAIAQQSLITMNNKQADYEAFKISHQQQVFSWQVIRTAKAESDLAQAAYQGAQHQIKAGQSELALLQVKLDDSFIRAPFAAMVIEKNADVGEWVEAGQAIITVSAKDNMQAWLDVPERFAVKLVNAPLQTITIAINDHSLLSEQIKPVFKVDKTSGSFYLIAGLSQTPADLMPGMFLVGWLGLGHEKNHLFVHKNAIVQNHNGTVVYKAVNKAVDIQKDNNEEAQTHLMPEAVSVKILFYDGSYAAIETEGQLVTGDLVVIEGNQRIVLTEPLRIIKSLAMTHDSSLPK